MASKSLRQALMLILFSLLRLSFTSEATTTCEGGIAIYWGQNKSEGNLTSTCDTGNYEIVLLAFLNVFGCGRPPRMSFCGGACTQLEPEIKHCQQKGVKVFLSLGGSNGENYNLCSHEDGSDVAKYLHTNFLSGKSGALGDVTLDGIDFHIQAGSNLYWEDLAYELDYFRRNDIDFYLSAAPRCPIPDYYLDAAIKTKVFDDIFVQFYNNPSCQYSPPGNYELLFESWNNWTSYVLSNNTVFLGLPAAADAAPSGGYIPPEWLVCGLLNSQIKNASNYGGVMLWNRYYDVQNHYSDKIKHFVPKCTDDLLMHSVTALSDTS